MDLLFFDKGRIDKKNQIQCTRALRPISLPLFAAPPPLYAAPPPLYELPPSAAPRLLIDFTMHQVHTIAKECNYLQYDISQIRWSNDRG